MDNSIDLLPLIAKLTKVGNKYESLANHRLELLREGLEATKRADGHWSDRVRWITWVEKVEKELEEESKQ